jgi:thioredoxin
MKPYKRFHSHLLRLFCMGFATFCFFMLFSCESRPDKNAKTPATESAIIAIDNADQFKKIWEKSGEHLLMFEFFADWCSPCKELEPVLEKIARENRGKVTVYKINTDRNSELLYSFRVSGIPHVIFVKNKESVYSLTGLYPQNMYMRIIDQFAAAVEKKSEATDMESRKL